MKRILGVLILFLVLIQCFSTLVHEAAVEHGGSSDIEIEKGRNGQNIWIVDDDGGGGEIPSSLSRMAIIPISFTSTCPLP